MIPCSRRLRIKRNACPVASINRRRHPACDCPGLKKATANVPGWASCRPGGSVPKMRASTTRTLCKCHTGTLRCTTISITRELPAFDHSLKCRCRGIRRVLKWTTKN